MDPCLLLLLSMACTREAPPSPDPVTPATPAPAAFDPIAVALPPTDAALHKAAKGPAHAGPLITATEGRVTGDASHGWTVTWSRHPPAGWEIEASATVSPSKQVKVTKAEAVFSAD